MGGAIAAALAIPFFILNSLAGLVGGAWLLWLGEWRLVLAGFVAAVTAPFWTSILLLPSLIFVTPAASLAERGNSSSAVVLGLLGALWTYAAVAAWCLTVFWYVPQFLGRNEPMLPFFLFAYAAATAPWAMMAQKDAQAGAGEASGFTTSAACIGCALILGYVLIAARPNFTTAIWLLAVPMMAAYLLSAFIAIAEGRRMARYRF